MDVHGAGQVALGEVLGAQRLDELHRLAGCDQVDELVAGDVAGHGKPPGRIVCADALITVAQKYVHMHYCYAMPLTDSDLDTWKAFINAHDRITRQINADLSAAGLPDLTVYDALWALRTGDGGRRRMGELAEAVVLSRTAIVRLVDRLEAAGLARREPVPEDRRGSYVAVTTEGRAMLSACGRSTRRASSASSPPTRQRRWARRWIGWPERKGCGYPHRETPVRRILGPASSEDPAVHAPEHVCRPCRALVRGQSQEGHLRVACVRRARRGHRSRLRDRSPPPTTTAPSATPVAATSWSAITTPTPPASRS